MISLRRLLTLGLSAIIVTSTLVSGWFSYREGLQSANELFDAKLAHSARVLHGLVDDSLSAQSPQPDQRPILIEVWAAEDEAGDRDPATEQGHVYETRLAFQVWDDSGRLLMHSDAGLLRPLAPLEVGFSKHYLDEQRWRVFVLHSESGLWYVAGEDNAIRKRLARSIAAGILVPLAIELPLIVALIWLVLGWGVRDLRRTIRQINARAAGRLDPIHLKRPPREVAATIRAVNSLLERLRSALGRERRFAGDAAHELRTPISALRVHLDNLAAAESESERRHSMNSLDQGLKRLSRLVEQLLLLSRLEPGATLPQVTRIDVAQSVANVVHEPAMVARKESITLRERLAGQPIWLESDPTSIELLFRNLLDNALRYTPDGGEVVIGLEELPDQGALLTIEDSGPGIPESARGRVFERFHRELGSGRDGSGLGLSIVQRVVEVLAARIELDDSPELGGLRVRVWLPAGPGLSAM